MYVIMDAHTGCNMPVVGDENGVYGRQWYTPFRNIGFFVGILGVERARLRGQHPISRSN